MAAGFDGATAGKRPVHGMCLGTRSMASQSSRSKQRATSRPRTLTTTSLVTTAMLLVAACATTAAPPLVGTDDPDASFVAHDTRDGLVIDRMANGEPAVVEPAAPWPWTGAPSFVLRERGKVAAGLWLTSPAEVVVRGGADGGAPIAGRVEPSWENGAIRLTLRPAAGAPLHTGTFDRLSHGAGPSRLTRLAVDSLDMQGRYEAPLLTDGGERVGWLRVELARRSRRPVFEALLPASVDERLAAATAEALDSEIFWIDNHVHGVSRAPENR
jgi:hypothetical protein